MTTKQTDTLGIPSLIKNLKKVKFFYTNHLVTAAYEAPSDAINGDKCILTRYTYYVGTSDVDGMVEENAVWNSAWDM